MSYAATSLFDIWTQSLHTRDNGYELVWCLDGYIFGGPPGAKRAGRIERRYFPPDPLD